MDFNFTAEQLALRESAHGYLSKTLSLNDVAAQADSADGWDRDSWHDLVGFDWTDPVLGPIEQTVLAEEMGYALYPGPWWSTVALTGPAMPSRRDRPATLAWLDAGPSGACSLRDAASTTCRAESSGTAWLVTGAKREVPDAQAADEFLVVARTTDGVALFTVQPTAARRSGPREHFDGTRRQFRLDFDHAEAGMLVTSDVAPAVLGAIRQRAIMLLAGEAVGLTQRVLELAAEHVRTRKQFGRPVGSFQAVAHPIVDVYVELALARSLCYRAAWCIAVNDPDSAESVALAAVSSRRAVLLGCETALQALGGTGFTWEHPLHRCYRRAQTIAGFEGFAAVHRADLADLLLDQRTRSPGGTARVRPPGALEST
jgi:alkylation response protein AidB-like acyl-CoA dehydrogenase